MIGGKMAAPVQITVRSVEERDRKQLANLIHFESTVHRHLDWRSPLDWIGRSPYLVAEGRNGLLAALVCPPDPPEVAWVRLFAVSSEWDVDDAWQVLWSQAQEYYWDWDEIQVAAIPLQNWFQALLAKSGFVHDHNIVILAWERDEKPGLFGFGRDALPRRRARPAPNPHVHIRPMNFDDIPAVHAIDVAAFEPIWQNSLSGLELAFRQAALATVAEGPDGLIGYQISTSSPVGGHLARLAVYPQYQGKGVGYQLVNDLLKQFKRRGAQSVTVNTQFNNKPSLSLYQKTGFRLTGEEYPIYECKKMGQ